MSETEAMVAEVARGTMTLRFFGSVRNKEAVIFEHVEEGATPDAIGHALSGITDKKGGFCLPDYAPKRRRGWSWQKVECWWFYDDPKTSHRQWCLTID